MKQLFLSFVLLDRTIDQGVLSRGISSTTRWTRFCTWRAINNRKLEIHMDGIESVRLVKRPDRNDRHQTMS